MAIPGEVELWLIRHGETEWSASGAHTSRSDIPLTARGEKSASAVGAWLAGKEFSLVLSSPRLRARETCRIAGYMECKDLASSLQVHANQEISRQPRATHGSLRR